MKRLSEEQVARFENNIMAIIAPLYAILGAVGAVFKISALEFLVTDPRALVPAIASFLFLLSRNILRVADELHEIRVGDNRSAQLLARVRFAEMSRRAKLSRGVP